MRNAAVATIMQQRQQHSFPIRVLLFLLPPPGEDCPFSLNSMFIQRFPETKTINPHALAGDHLFMGRPLKVHRQ